MFSNSKQSIPPLFVEIMRNDDERTAIHSRGQAISQADWRKLGSLYEEKREYRRAAEKALSWNVDKGNAR